MCFQCFESLFDFVCSVRACTVMQNQSIILCCLVFSQVSSLQTRLLVHGRWIFRRSPLRVGFSRLRGTTRAGRALLVAYAKQVCANWVIDHSEVFERGSSETHGGGPWIPMARVD